jgi:hypothetical protein
LDGCFVIISKQPIVPCKITSNKLLECYYQVVN